MASLRLTYKESRYRESIVVVEEPAMIYIQDPAGASFR